MSKIQWKNSSKYYLRVPRICNITAKLNCHAITNNTKMTRLLVVSLEKTQGIPGVIMTRITIYLYKTLYITHKLWIFLWSFDFPSTPGMSCGCCMWYKTRFVWSYAFFGIRCVWWLSWRGFLSISGCTSFQIIFIYLAVQ